MVVSESGKAKAPCCCIGDSECGVRIERSTEPNDNDMLDGGNPVLSSCHSNPVHEREGEIQKPSIRPRHVRWKRGSDACCDQFEDYSEDDDSCFLKKKRNPDDDEDPWTYCGKRLQALQFPLGGFGTGQITFQGDGTLQGFTILNQFHNQEYSPLNKLPGFLFGIQARTTRKRREHDSSESRTTSPVDEMQSFVLQTPQNYTQKNRTLHMREEAHVTDQQVRRMEMLPGIRSLTCRCQYPSITVNYDMPGFPLMVQLQAVTPLIPGNIRDSSWPVAIFDFTCTNTTDDVVEMDLMQSALNLVGWDGNSPCNNSSDVDCFYQNVNIPVVGDSYNDSNDIKESIRYAGWNMTRANQEDNLDAKLRGNICLVAVVDNETTSPTTIGNELGLIVSDEIFDETQLWELFVQRRFMSPTDAKPTAPSNHSSSYLGAVVQSATIPPNTAKSFRFVLTWHFPNRPSYSDRPNLPSPILGNRYAHWYGDAVDVMKSFLPKAETLVSATQVYVETLYSTKIPFEFLESAAGRLACMRSPTMFWTKDDGIILGNEGNGCCPLNCSHVYGYTTLLERMYPDVAKDMLYSNFIRNFDQEHGCSMRFGTAGFAIDGSLACVIKVLLVVQQCDSNFGFLRQVWPNVKRQMEIVFDQYDTDDDGVIRCLQKNTYDSSMQGANTFIGSYWVTALKATYIMATWMGDNEFASRCIDRAKLSAQSYERICWKEEYGYYVADVDETNCQHSYATGCFVDQLCAIGLSTACGLGYNFDPGHEATARLSILKYNKVTKPPFQDLQKHFYDGDTGITVNTYPHGKLPNSGVYDTLVSTGFTYPVVAGLLFDGSTEAASIIAKNIRLRHSGINRSPWNEPECGLLYSRSMASWNVYDQACGFAYDSSRAAICVDPKVKLSPDFDCFIIVQDGWGQFRHEKDTVSVRALYGYISVKTLQVNNTSAIQAAATLHGNKVSTAVERGLITFANTVKIPTGATLIVKLSGPPGSCNVTVKQLAFPSWKQEQHVLGDSRHCNCRHQSDVEKCCNPGDAASNLTASIESPTSIVLWSVVLIASVVCWTVITYQ